MNGALPQVVVVAAGIITIIGLATALIKIVIPLAKAITDFREKIVPNVDYMPRLKDLAEVLPTLRSIEAEFTGDSGSTLRDAMDRLERLAKEAAAAATSSMSAATEFARVNRESITRLEAAMIAVRELASDDRQLAREDREQILGAVRSLARVEASGARTEVAAATVKDELAATQQRAGQVHGDEEPGAAADAALRPPGQS